MSYKTASALGLITIKVNAIQTNPTEPIPLETLEDKYPSLFNGIWKLKYFEVKLHIDENVPPIAQSARRILFHLWRNASATLNDLEAQEIIEKIASEQVPLGCGQLLLFQKLMGESDFVLIWECPTVQ